MTTRVTISNADKTAGKLVRVAVKQGKPTDSGGEHVQWDDLPPGQSRDYYVHTGSRLEIEEGSDSPPPAA